MARMTHVSRSLAMSDLFDKQTRPTLRYRERSVETVNHQYFNVTVTLKMTRWKRVSMVGVCRTWTLGVDHQRVTPLRRAKAIARALNAAPVENPPVRLSARAELLL